MAGRAGPYHRFVKRPFDFVVVILCAPLCILIITIVAILVRYNLGAPVFFTQTRPGLNGKPFKMVKFRTMTNARDENGALLSDSERLTRFGQQLRGTSLDELPELWNVFKGDMSLVGPRPLLMEYLTRYDSVQSRRHEVRPGVTGLAQVMGRNLLEWKERIRTDVDYVNRCSFLLDLWIIYRTFVVVLRRDGISSLDVVTMKPFVGNDDDQSDVK